MTLIILCGVALILHATGVWVLPLWLIILVSIPLGVLFVTVCLLFLAVVLEKSTREQLSQNYAGYRRVCGNCGIEVSNKAIECPQCGCSGLFYTDGQERQRRE